MNGLVNNIAKIVEENFPDDSYFLVDLAIKGGRGNEKVVILIDGDQGVDIETCSKMSRVVSEELDRLDVLKEKYTLEVSSPGIDYPLSSIRQYKKNIGKHIVIMLHDNKNLRGKLIGVDDQGIRIIYEDGGKKKPPYDTYIAFKDITKSKVLVTFK